ncbi:uncharacterized protein LOC143033930 isoform X2 [Oratosquilla oratoria]|uniref:uncharacterized protein LOC143033930 isoform X2 n=1 Tax=Oratosquilla oratoria TaxID=337810 RepID=UPI003F76CABF
MRSTGRWPDLQDTRQIWNDGNYLPNGRPVLTGGEKKYRPGDIVSVNCSVPMSMPAAVLTWYINNQKAQKKYLKEYPLEEDSEGRKSATLGLTFTAQRCHFSEGQLTLTCNATVHSLYAEHALHTGVAAHPVSAHFGDNVNGSESVSGCVRVLLVLPTACLLILFKFL